ncbi:GSCFA domain-containing protein [Hyunsoonleella sp. SJ7]|uniref:GSCFA domain-containing protein n=1 Tax=Hyunsoonleella aquatilis TaxID=2762758 RepID=A0A923KLG1_9FLAO|nr:GSCFA domain-containing protein [Hyunsoonleella aquatilis]MBC3757895.1 GSCFA domain-containing protein [Hyunsoonleella aquatilis]
MNLQTKIPLLKQSNNLIDYKSNILLIGSCFSENIGKKLDYFKFQNTKNPFGILFNPKAIETLIENAVRQKVYKDSDVFFHNEQWQCFDSHSKLSQSSKEGLRHQLNYGIDLTGRRLKDSSHIIITLGTAWVYRQIESDSIVANCHKVPQNQFKKELLSVDSIFESLQNIVSLVKSVNTKATIIFTVSPVRHLKDGFAENTLSKSHLISSIHKMIPPMGDRGLYFPSYEMMMDELRDYRFYSEDMIHPNPTAINYIWERFKSVWISEDSFQTMEAVDTIQRGLQHKPFNPNSQAHQKFLQNLEAQKARVAKQFPHIKF